MERSNSSSPRDVFGLWILFDEKASRCSLTKSAKSTISICAAIIMFTILLFMLSTFDPGKVNSSQPSLPMIGPRIEISFSKRWRVLQRSVGAEEHKKAAKKEWSRGRSKLALHGMGMLFRRGTRAMNELVVGHIQEETSENNIRWFLRTLHRSGATARADVVIIFPWSPVPPQILGIIEEENKNFMKLFSSLIREASVQQTKASLNISDVELSKQVLASSRIVVNRGGGEFSGARLNSSCRICGFNAAAFKKAALERRMSGVEGGANEPLWGLNNGTQKTGSEETFFEPVWGSIVGFEVAELNPDDALLGFLDQPPMGLRRWACYQMLLGKVRHKFKHVLLTDVKGVLVLGDAMAVVRKKSGLYLSLQDRTWSEEWGLNFTKGKKSIFKEVYGNELWSSLEKKEREMRLVNSGVILGGIQPVRRLANAMMTEIVKVALQRKSRNPFPDGVLLTYLLQKSSVLGKKVMEHLHLVENPDSVVHSLEKSKQKDLFFKKKSSPYTILHGYVDMNVTATVRDDICSSPADSVVYGDCIHRDTSHQESR